MELRSELSKLLQGEVNEQKLRLQSAATKVASDVENHALPVIDSDLSDWLNDCVDADSIQKVHSLCMFMFYYST